MRRNRCHWKLPAKFSMESDTERKYKVWLRAEIVVVFIVIVIVWGLLLLLLSYFYLSSTTFLSG